jgi:hypothetical protein
MRIWESDCDSSLFMGYSWVGEGFGFEEVDYPAPCFL